MITQAEKARAFRALHERSKILVMPNPWDAGTAKLLASLGFEAVATTSLGFASSLGRLDGTLSVTREELIANCRAIASATDLPTNADLENGYADDPDEAAAIIRMAAEAGAVGGSIEDATGNVARPIYDFDLAVKRVAAAARVAQTLPFPFTLTARAENYLHNRPDLHDTIRRLQAFEAGRHEAVAVAQHGTEVLVMPVVIGGVTVEVLQAFADAWNRHDVDALMSFMTDDCVFEASAGPDICGTRYVGREAVRAGFAEVWVTFLDAHWGNARHFVIGHRGVSEWTFTGTRADGTRVEVNGCDVFTFRDGKIALKNSYRKNRPPVTSPNR